MRKIPVNIITGGLGVGKTTTICHLLSIKPLDEKWAILVNEFGTLGIDGAILSSSGEKSNDGVTIRELAGGCMCCTLSGPLSTSIASLVRQAKPDRLIIEPSGLGHPAGLLDALLGPHLSSSLDVRAVLCLVDVASTSPPSYRLPSPSSSSFSSSSHSNLLTSAPPSLENVNEEWIQILSQQILAADIVIGHRTDAASSDQIDRFLDWIQNDLWPPKDEVILASHGRIPLDLLDRPRCAGLLNRALSSSARPRRRPAALRGVCVLLPAEPKGGNEELRGVAAVEGVSVDSATVEEPGTTGNTQSETKTTKGEESFSENGLKCSSSSSLSSSSSFSPIPSSPPSSFASQVTSERKEGEEGNESFTFLLSSSLEPKPNPPKLTTPNLLPNKTMSLFPAPRG